MSNEVENGCGFISALIWIVVLISWINNLMDLLSCDFEAPFKDEAIHLIGVFIPPVSVITCWF